MSCIYDYNKIMKENCERCDVIRTLKDAGLSKTLPRKAILEILIKADRPLSVKDIMKKNFGKNTINKVTVYRALSIFKEEGIIREIQHEQRIKHYEMACRHNPVHPHFYCNVCKTMTCLSPLTLSQALDLFAKPYDFTIDNININITGVCSRCRSKK